MQHYRLYILAIIFVFLSNRVQAQDDEGSVIQNLTPSKLIGKGQYDLKWFNNLYTETKSTFASGKQARQTFFTSTLEAYTGVGSNNRWNVGAIFEIRSNVIGGRGALEVFQFDGELGTARSGFTSIAPSIKFVPFQKIGNFSIQSSLFIPLVEAETKQGVFLDQSGYTFQNRFFYDQQLGSNQWQLFLELNTELHFGEKEKSFANNSLTLIPGAFLSYFPSYKSTVLVLLQHFQRLDLGNEFIQDFTALGFGAKYQLTDALNIEALYTNFVRGANTGLGQTFNLGFRAVL